MNLRSILFTPGNRIDRVAKAWSTVAADLVVADLEDAVSLADKDASRAAVVDLLASARGDHLAVRINPTDTPMGMADVEALASLRPAWIVVPKVEATFDLDLVRERVPLAKVLAIIETATGILNASAIAAAADAVAFGAEDLAADAGMRRTSGNQEVSVPRSMVALSAAAARTPCIDMITADYQDDERFEREADEAVGLGYAGKMCLHPRQVSLAHAAWKPAEAELLRARAIVAAAAGQETGGIVVVDGQMVDVPLIRQAQALLDRAG